MENNIKSEIYLTIWIIIFNTSNSIYVPDEGINQKPIAYTSGIITSSHRKSFQIHHNYSRVYHQNSDSYFHTPDEETYETSQSPHPIYNNAHTYGARPPQFERQIYVLNGTRIRKNENPARQIVKYNKEKRSPKIGVYRTCPENATGQFVYEFSCNQFLNCWRGRGFVQNCAPGTLFNPKTLECDFPEKVYCVSGPRQTNLKKERKFESVRQVGCPKEFSGLIPNYTDCSKFINCVSGIENLMDCPPGTLFDVDKNVCDFAHKANCFNGQNQQLVEHNIDGKLDFTQERQQLRYKLINKVRCPNGGSGLHKHPTDCAKFLNCANGETYVQDCAPGTLFNPIIKICDFPYNVRCENNSLGIGDTYYDVGNYSQNKSRHYGTRNEHYLSSTSRNPYRQGQFYVPYRTSTSDYTDNENNQNLQNPSFDRRKTLHNENLTGFGHYVQQYNTGSDYYYNSPTNRYEDTYDTFTTSDIDNSRSTYQSNNNSQNQYQKGSRQHELEIYGSDPVLSRPNENVNTWNEQNQYLKNKNQQGAGTYGSTSEVYYRPYQNNNGYQSQGSSIYTAQYHNNENRGYQQPYGTKGSNGNDHNVNYGQNKNNWNANIHPGYDPNYRRNQNRNNRRQPESGQIGTVWVPSDSNQEPMNGNSQVIYPYRNNQRQFEASGYIKPRPFSTQYLGSSTFEENAPGTQRNEWQQVQDYNRWNSQENGNTFQRPNSLDEEGITSNYDQIVNINQVTKTTPFRNSYESFFGPTTMKPIIRQPTNYDSFVSGNSRKYVRVTTPSTRKSSPIGQINDYDDTFVPPHGNKFVRATTPQMLEKSWPPPFPSTDVNADYVFEYEDNDEITLEAENSYKNDETLNCGKNDFRCLNDKCISKSFLCNGFKDCPNGEDELNCLGPISKFSLQKDRKLAVLEKERWNNVSTATCALLCVESPKFKCRSFNYRKIDKTCFLTNTNEGLTGGLIFYYPFDYYELNSEKLNCSGMYICANKKCINRKKICDGADDCGDRMDEKGCKPQDYGYSVKLSGSKNKNEGYVEVTAFEKTGFICDDQFGLRDADVVCKELGFPLGAAEVKGNSFFAKNFTKPFYIMDDVGCIGNETRLMDCDFSGWGVHNCLEQEIAGVVCKTPLEKCASDYWQCDTGQECLPLAFVCDGLLDCSDGSDEGSQHCDAPTQIRLVNGSTRQEGRVEIRHHGIWGTICDDDFNEDAAKVICKQLGYKGSASLKKDSHFGSGSGPIWLDQVFCFGNETSVEDCSHWNWGEHNCEHIEDVGVICSNTHEYEERHQSVVSVTLPQEFPERCGYRNDNIFDQNDDVHFRVVRGSTAKKGDYPWQAAIRVKGKTTTTHWCGAVIISEKFVLTAAHCLVGYPKGAYVIVAGDYNVDEPEGTEQEFYIEDYYIHENFRKGHKMNNDIALIKLKGNGFRLGGDVQPICLPEAHINYETNLNCTISGFGSIESGRSAFSHNLRAGWVQLQKREICTMPHVYGENLTDGMICAGSLDEGVDACEGDSGGPLACLNNGVFTLYGITSWGQHCGYANKPGVYVKVGHYRKWIDDNFRKYSVN